MPLIKVRNGEPRPFTSRPPLRSGTVLAYLMTRRHLAVSDIITPLHCSARQLTYYLAREKRPTPLQVGKLCDLLDVDPDDIVDELGYLKRKAS